MLQIPERLTSLFADEIAKDGITLPRVHTLVVGPYCDFAVSICPNVTAISNYGLRSFRTSLRSELDKQPTRNLIKAAGAAPNVTNLEITEWWQVELVEAIHEALPHLPSLSLQVEVGDFGRGIADFIPALSRFEHLEHLALPDAYILHVGFNPPRCGNAFMGPGGMELAKQVAQEGRNAEERAAKMVASSIPRLKDVWIGDMARAEVVRNEDGSFKEVVMHRGT